MHGVIIIEGHVQGLANVRSLGEMGVPVIVIDTHNCIARYSRYCKKFFKCPDYTSAEFIDFLLELAEREKLQGWSLFPSNDHIVYNLSKNKVKVEKVYKTIAPDFKDLMKIYDKYAFLNLAKHAEIQVPKTLLIDEITDYAALPYPLLIKGREGLTFFKATGKKGFAVNEISEFKKIIDVIANKIDKEKIILQEMIPFNDSSDVWSFAGFGVNGETKAFWIGKKLREHPAKFGTATMAMSDYDEAIESYGKQVIKMLDYTGPCEIEFIRDKRNNTFKLIEMNPRTWLWVSLARYCGVDFAKYTYEHLNGIQPVYPAEYTKNIKWMNFWTDIFFTVKGVIRKELTIKGYFNDNKGKVIQAVYDKEDIMPFVMMTILLPYIMIKRQ